MIVIDMDMPISCSECPICHPKGKDDPWNFACFQGMMDININEWNKERNPNCPIKCDIEDIKAEIKDEELYTKINDIDVIPLNTVLEILG